LQVAQASIKPAAPVDVPKPELAAAESENTNAQNSEQNGQADTGNLEPANTNQPPLEVAKGFVQKLWAQLLASFEGVTGINRIILLAALALPFLLIGFWLLMRRSSKHSKRPEQHHSNSLADQARVSPNHAMDHDMPRETNEKLSKQKLQFEDQIEEIFSDDQDPVFADLDAPESQVEHSTNHSQQKTKEPTNSFDLNALLLQHEAEEQLGLVVEFMIYWMAFTDERYEPELKRRIFAEKEPDDHDLIKRCVLSYDFGAFAFATTWLQENTNAEEREQILNLLMALLVYEEGVTPAQNTMLRFLSNAFGLTHNELDELFQTAFGHALPPMPRPDKPSWWDKQTPDKLKRWDARSVAQQSHSIQARVKLGLPLSGELTLQDINERHERAISRCQPDNFNLLTPRERQLAESQQTKYNSAAQTLTEISA